ncbi:hypothetical protein G7K_0012-t1 [Saitoella complicata NRRL Y-17804]|uniref:Uncharacterized protein n=1 Tax=Saitoella complicata (strain BCRC 22490 / CBS 7301 / JCM 7358 / NBRC 10748 / NRRL Y-17804) TaxID=698492 RepID=A0A0E9N8N4_SAICN|nr:hypothetical protein G7K_0012-t1 [Saitoella complicata NRRL Y-17804]
MRSLGALSSAARCSERLPKWESRHSNVTNSQRHHWLDIPALVGRGELYRRPHPPRTPRIGSAIGQAHPILYKRATPPSTIDF